MVKIPLLNFYIEELGGEPGVFGEWEVPMVYTSSIEEHMAVRNNVGVFDVSHMGRIRLRGSDVLEFIQYLYTKDLSKVKEGWMSGPTLALNQLARVKDDEMLYKISDEEWLVVVNALYIDKMIEYYSEVISAKKLDVKVEDLTMKYSMIAVQGPKAAETLSSINGSEWIADLKTLEFRLNEEIGGVKVFLVSRSGWTGEDGFEIWGEHSEIRKLVLKLVEMGVKPAGLIARDTLRMEMGFVLGEHEYGEDPVRYPCALSLRYGLGAIDWKKGYVGEEALRACRRNGVRWIRVGIKMSKKHARIIPRENTVIYVEDLPVGWVTSGSFSPVLKRGIAQAYIDSRYALFGEPVELEIRSRRYKGKIVDFPFIKPHSFS